MLTVANAIIRGVRTHETETSALNGSDRLTGGSCYGRFQLVLSHVVKFPEFKARTSTRLF